MDVNVHTVSTRSQERATSAEAPSEFPVFFPTTLLSSRQILRVKQVL